MEKEPEKNRGADLPPCATEFIRRVVRRMWYRRSARRDVQTELTTHFEDAVRDCATAEEKERRVREVIEGFGDAKLLAALCHRAKKRCRPLWLKIVLRSVQGLGIALLYCVLCSLPLLLARPTIRVNYGAWLNNHWRPDGQGVENAKVSCDRAADLVVWAPDGPENKIAARGWNWADYDDVDGPMTAAWLAKNLAALNALRQGANIASYWPTYDSNESGPIETSILGDKMESLSRYRRVVFTLRQQIVWEAREGKVAEALEDCFVLRRLGRHLQGKGLMLEQLVGISIEALGYDGIIALLQGVAIPPAVLDRAQGELVRNFDLSRRAIDLEGETAFWLDHIQRTFTDDGRGGGHALSNGFIYAAGDWRNNLINTLRFRYPDRRDTVAMVEQHFRLAQARLDALPGADRRAEPGDTTQAATLNLLLSLGTAGYERAAQLAWRLKTHEAATITLVAIQRYCRDNGSYPDNLNQLVERGFLTQLPQDPFGRGPLTYRKTDQGFLLYSWGTERKDHGGQMGTGSQGLPHKWADNGDWIFWPVPER